MKIIIDAGLLIDIARLFLLLLAIFYVYRVWLRTEKRLKKTSLYIFLSVAILLIIEIAQLKYGICSFKYLENWIVSLFKMVAILFLVVGLWYLQRTIREVDGELRSNGKFRIKRKNK